MHSAWFNTGDAAISATTVPIVRSNSTTFDNGTPVINVASTLISIVDAYGRAIPGTTTIKFDISDSPQGVRVPIENTSAFLTYTVPFTAETAAADAGNWDYVYISARAFDTVTGSSTQTEPTPFQTRVIPQPEGTP